MLKNTLAMVLVLVSTLTATAQPSEITLSCNGQLERSTSKTIDIVTEPVKDLGIIINLINKTVIGFYGPPSFPVAKILEMDEGLVYFEGNDLPNRSPYHQYSGQIDRITGDAKVLSTVHDVNGTTTTGVWSLTCVPKRRLV